MRATEPYYHKKDNLDSTSPELKNKLIPKNRDKLNILLLKSALITSLTIRQSFKF